MIHTGGLIDTQTFLLVNKFQQNASNTFQTELQQVYIPASVLL